MPDSNQDEFFKNALGALSVAASSPLAAILLAVLIGSATFLYWKQAGYKSLASTLELVPEADRLERIRIDYGVRPKEGVSATDWLSSRHQSFVFWSYIVTIAVVFLGFVVIYGRTIAIPGGVHRTELIDAFSKLQGKVAAFDLAAKSARDAFVLAGENAIDPDAETDAILTKEIERYNAVYDDLRVHQASDTSSVTRWLDKMPDLATQVAALTTFALNDVHQDGVLELNVAAFKHREEVAALKRESPMSEVQPRSKFFRANAGVFGKFSRPV